MPILSEEALSDLDEICLYIASDSPTAADRVIDEIYEAIYGLA
jgi:plasmid stabilization system protein ParE